MGEFTSRGWGYELRREGVKEKRNGGWEWRGWRAGVKREIHGGWVEFRLVVDEGRDGGVLGWRVVVRVETTE